VIIRHLATGSLLWHLRHYSLAAFLNTFTPANLGGDIYRLMALRHSGNSGLDAAFLLLRERYFGLLGYCGFFMICLGGMAAGGGAIPSEIVPASWVIGAAITVLTFLSPLLSLAEPVLRRSAPLLRRLLPLWPQARKAVAFPLDATFLACMALTVASTASWVFAGTLIARDLGVAVSYGAVGMVAMLVELARWIPVAVQGIGMREGLVCGPARPVRRGGGGRLRHGRHPLHGPERRPDAVRRAGCRIGRHRRLPSDRNTVALNDLQGCGGQKPQPLPLDPRDPHHQR